MNKNSEIEDLIKNIKLNEDNNIEDLIKNMKKLKNLIYFCYLINIIFYIK